MADEGSQHGRDLVLAAVNRRHLQVQTVSGCMVKSPSVKWIGLQSTCLHWHCQLKCLQRSQRTACSFHETTQAWHAISMPALRRFLWQTPAKKKKVYWTSLLMNSVSF